MWGKIWAWVLGQGKKWLRMELKHEVKNLDKMREKSKQLVIEKGPVAVDIIFDEIQAAANKKIDKLLPEDK